VQSIAGGNTMTFNQSAKNLLEKAGKVNVPAHDWWTYLVVTGADGRVFYDSAPHLLYRQHKNSLIGGNDSLKALFGRSVKMFKGQFKQFNTLNVESLLIIDELFSKGHRDVLILFRLMRSAHLIDRLRLIQVCGLYRQTRRGTIGLYIAALFNRI
jgi:hypothetical protein